MPGRLLAASAAHGMDELHALSASALMLSVTVENACDYFALAHAHDNQDLMDVCAELASKEMAAVTESEGFKRHLAERSAVGTGQLMARMGQLGSPEAKGRKRKREEEEVEESAPRVDSSAGAASTAKQLVVLEYKESCGAKNRQYAGQTAHVISNNRCWIEVQLASGADAGKTLNWRPSCVQDVAAQSSEAQQNQQAAT